MGQIQNVVNQGLSSIAQVSVLNRAATDLGKAAVEENAAAARQEVEPIKEEAENVRANINKAIESNDPDQKYEAAVEADRVIGDAEKSFNKTYGEGAWGKYLEKKAKYGKSMKPTEAADKALEDLYYEQQGITTSLGRKAHQFEMLTQKVSKNLLSKFTGGDK